MNEKEYQTYVEQVTPKVNGWLSFCKAFVSGGIICVIGQCLYNWFKAQGMMHTLANNYTTLILILASVLLTGFNLVGPITKFAGPDIWCRLPGSPIRWLPVPSNLNGKVRFSESAVRSLILPVPLFYME